MQIYTSHWWNCKCTQFFDIAFHFADKQLDGINKRNN